MPQNRAEIVLLVRFTKGEPLPFNISVIFDGKGSLLDDL